MKHIIDLLLRNDHKERDGISVTTLCDSPQVKYLKNKHRKEIDKIIASDPIRWSYNAFLGRAVHLLLESSGFDRVMEQTIEDEFEDIKIYGTPDAVDLAGKCLEDYKTTSAWALLEAPKREWVNQLNLYRWMLQRKNIKIETMKVYAFIKDWSERDAKEGGKYPMKPIVEIEIPDWKEVYKKPTDEDIIRMFVARHKADPSTFICTDKEVWRKETVYAVMKPGAKRSVANFSERTPAEERAKVEGAKVQVRPGTATKCERYCVCSKFCPQWTKECAK